jgi:hypothetical protein
LGEQGPEATFDERCFGNPRVRLYSFCEKRLIDVHRHTNGMHQYIIGVCIDHATGRTEEIEYSMRIYVLHELGRCCTTTVSASPK